MKLRLWNNDSWNNFRGLSELQRDMDRMFDAFLTPHRGEGELTSAFQPATDLDETEDHYEVSMDLPGIPKDSVKIELHNGTLTVSGERKYENKGKDKEGGRFIERSYGHFRREFSLPKTVDADRVEAEFNDGVLKIFIPKTEVAKPKQIKIGEKAKETSPNLKRVS